MARFGTNHKGGRPKSNATLMVQKMREELVKTVKKEFKPLIQAQIDIAKGTYVKKSVTLKNGQTIDGYYETKPDVTAAKTILEQAIGKPQESLKVEAEVKTIVDLVSTLDEE